LINKLPGLLFASDFEVVRETLGICQSLLNTEEEVARYTAGVISVNRILELANSENFSCIALKVMGYLCSVEKKYVEMVISKDGLVILSKGLMSDNERLVYSSCFALSYIPMWGDKYVEMLIEMRILIKVMEIARTTKSSLVRHEAGNIILNCCKCKDINLLSKLIELGSLHSLNELLTVTNKGLAISILKLLKILLTADTQERKLFKVMEDIGYIKTLSKLQLSTDINLYKNAVAIQELFEYSEIMEDEVM